MTMGGGSFLSHLLKQGARNGQVLDSTTKLAAGRQTHVTIPPFNRDRSIGGGESPELGLLNGGGSVGQSTQVGAGSGGGNYSPDVNGGGPGITQPVGGMLETPESTTGPSFPTTATGELTNIVDKIDAQLDRRGLEEAYFRFTGRPMHRRERLLLEAKQNFIALHGRAPNMKELMYEAQRGLISGTDAGTRGRTL